MYTDLRLTNRMARQ